MRGKRPELRSAAFTVAVRHVRFWPKPHAFTYRLFYLAIELDELASLDGPVLRIDRPGLMSVWQRDYLRADEESRPEGAPAESLRTRFTRWCERRGCRIPPDARVLLVTLPRVLGYQFNPVSFYLCLGADGRPIIAVAEVTNTFREVKAYIVPPAATDLEPVFRVRSPKDFYVSPFSPREAAFEFILRVPGDTLALQVDHWEDGRRTLHSALVGQRRPWTQLQLFRLWLTCPLLSLGVIARIHWQALRLWAKRVPWFRHGDKAGRRSARPATPRPVSA